MLYRFTNGKNIKYGGTHIGYMFLNPSVDVTECMFWKQSHVVGFLYQF